MSQAGMHCLLQVFHRHPTRLIGPFARRRDGNDYVLEELVAVPGASYDFILPRIMMLHARNLGAYGGAAFQRLHRYVEEQEVSKIRVM